LLLILSMRVREVMASDVITCGPDESLSAAAGVMHTQDCGVLPVLDPDLKLIGIITDRDIALAAFHDRLPLREISVGSAMTRHPTTCAPDDELEEAEQIMRSNQVMRLPVVDDAGQLVGIVSLGDIARHTAELRRSGRDPSASDGIVETLAAVGERRVVVPGAPPSRPPR
jgi:CBS domain-containing protein